MSFPFLLVASERLTIGGLNDTRAINAPRLITQESARWRGKFQALADDPNNNLSYARGRVVISVM
jgi:hypothetical protein